MLITFFVIYKPFVPDLLNKEGCYESQTAAGW